MKLPVPQRGQPLDVAFINDIVSSVNELWNKIMVNISAYSSLWTLAGRKSIKTSESKFVSGYQEVTLGATTTAGASQEFTFTFDVGFMYPPIVVVSPVSTSTSSAIKTSLRAIITAVTTTDVKIIIVNEGTSSADIKVGVNLIAVGVPV